MGNSPSADSAAAPSRKSYNVYNQEIDVTNQMPVVPNQLPWPGQQRLLPTERVASSIPKGGGGQWVFPSQQMFFNALQRKGKGGNVTEEDMHSVVLTHNTMNELTWRQVMLWERLNRGGDGAEPALVRFLGRPDDLSPRARARTLFGGACGGPGRSQGARS
jgi:cytochrome c heme-lyase